MKQTTQTVEQEIRELQNQIESIGKKIIELRKKQPEEVIQNYSLLSTDGQSVDLSDLFGDKNELLIVHNMGKACVYCTMWADGFNGLGAHLEDRMPYVVLSPDPPAVQKDFADSRNWRFRMVSANGSSINKDLGFQNETGQQLPGVSALVKLDSGKIIRVGKDFFGPGDFYNAAWHLFDLFPKGSDHWGPKYSYE